MRNTLTWRSGRAFVYETEDSGFESQYTTKLLIKQTAKRIRFRSLWVSPVDMQDTAVAISTAPIDKVTARHDPVDDETTPLVELEGHGVATQRM